MNSYKIGIISSSELSEGLVRKSIDLSNAMNTAKIICDDIKANGSQAVFKYARRFDGYKRESPRVSKQELEISDELLSSELRLALLTAYRNILRFHEAQKPRPIKLETSKGVFCERIFRSIENVGLYIPGGTAELPSTVLMLGVPAMIAGCRRIVLVTPAAERVSPAVLYAAKLCGISEIYAIGGAQAIAMLAYGIDTVPRVEKIFGPGNQFVTAAKMIVSIDPSAGCSIDMPAGPSEVLIIADDSANPVFIAADMLSQLEHGMDSQAILLTDSEELAEQTSAEIEKQIVGLPRQAFAAESLKNSLIVKVQNIDEAIGLSNAYAPEHLILNFSEARQRLSSVQNAGSVFIGPYSPESAGDYASGTNHSLPTSGYAKSIGGVTVESFMKSMTVQELSKDGLKKLAPAISAIAEAENLYAHKRAVTIRLEER